MKHTIIFPRGGQFHLITNEMQKKRVQLIFENKYYSLYRVPIIHLENILKFYLKYI